jgi:hypothetical protein
MSIRIGSRVGVFAFMATWRIAESLETLRKQLNAAFPKRSKASDGGIGDAHHASRNSDHNPWVKDKKGIGVVTARDFTHDPRTGIDCEWLAETLVANKDPRIKYLIWNKQICSSVSSPWKWRSYKGSNAHTKHLHISVSDAPVKYDSTKAWKLDFPKQTTNDIAKLVQDSAAASPVPSTAENQDSVSTSQPVGTGEFLPVNLTEQPPNTDSLVTEAKTTEVEQKDGKTVAQELTVTTPKGDLPDATPTKVTKNGPLAKWLFSSGGILTIFTGVWGFVQANSNVIAVAILVLGLIIVALIFRGAITDAIRMTAASDPDKNNVT